MDPSYRDQVSCDNSNMRGLFTVPSRGCCQHKHRPLCGWKLSFSCLHSRLDSLKCICLSFSFLFFFLWLSRLRNDRQRDGRPHSHDDVHHVGGGLALPGLHPLLRPEGPVRHLRYHIRAELHPFCPQLQATGLLERGLEAAAAGQAGLSCSERQWKIQ